MHSGFIHDRVGYIVTGGGGISARNKSKMIIDSKRVKIRYVTLQPGYRSFL